METQGRVGFDNYGAGLAGGWFNHVAVFGGLGYVTFFISMGSWASLPHFLPHSSLSFPWVWDGAPKRTVHYRSPSAHYALTSLRFVLK